MGATVARGACSICGVATTIRSTTTGVTAADPLLSLDRRPMAGPVKPHPINAMLNTSNTGSHLKPFDFIKNLPEQGGRIAPIGAMRPLPS
jgi:hypothetical protein